MSGDAGAGIIRLHNDDPSPRPGDSVSVFLDDERIFDGLLWSMRDDMDTGETVFEVRRRVPGGSETRTFKAPLGTV